MLQLAIDHPALVRRIVSDTSLLDQVRAVLTGVAAREAVYDGCGHAPHLEQPERSSADVTTFLT